MCNQERLANGALLMIAMGALLYLASVVLAPKAHSAPASETREAAVKEVALERSAVPRDVVGVEHLFAFNSAASGPTSFGY